MDAPSHYEWRLTSTPKQKTKNMAPKVALISGITSQDGS